MKEPRDHYVPRLHLRLFGFGPENESLWRYDKESGRTSKSSVGASAYERGYYSVKQSDGTVDRGIEEALGRAESPAIQVIRGLLDLGPGRYQMSQSDREALAAYVALLYGRVPRVRNLLEAATSLAGSIYMDVELSNPERFRERSLEMGMPDDPAALEAKREELLAEARRVNLTMHPPAEWATVFPLSVALDAVMPLLLSMRWYLISLPEPHLILGDNPVILEPGLGHPAGKGIGPGTPGVEIFIPLSPDRALVMKDEPGTGELIVLPGVRSDAAVVNLRDWSLGLNKSTWTRAERYIFSRERSDLDRVRVALPATEVNARSAISVSGLEAEWERYAGDRIKTKADVGGSGLSSTREER